MTPNFTFDPIRRSLYSAEELLTGYDPADVRSYANSLDFRIMQEYVRAGGAQPDDYLASLMRSLHDATITQHLANVLDGKRVAAIMGGHSMARSNTPDSDYALTAQIAKGLAERGMLVLSGGGPGAMEATHLGALFAGNDEGLRKALNDFAAAGVLTLPPDQNKILAPDGTPDFKIVEEYAAWSKPAIEIWKSQGKKGAGISIPTYQYGQEPFSPFAEGIAKYFQNSIREDGLLAVATHGIVYVKGGAGTLQEVFQDAAQNYYHTFPAKQGAGYFSPMVFFGPTWSTDRPVQPLLDSLFAGSAEYKSRVLFTSSVEAAVDFISGFAPPHPNVTIAALADKPSAV
ncbi:LOG family protein [Bradyrhizobium sp. HKCCYLS2038]|uniref:LOG family protein n=1 Tax=unclassified Bradyrhizobium TaxID=2631580 RepID=UPI003EBC8261